jgi:nicotinamide mononucleotide transporter
MGLQVYYMAISIYGWIIWTRGKPSEQETKSLPVTRISARLGVILLSVWLALWLIIALILDRFTDSTIPVWDALTTAGGIVGTWMLARKKLENWILWIFVDSVSVGLYIWKGLYPTAILFVIYIIMALLGYREWKKSLTAA